MASRTYMSRADDDCCPPPPCCCPPPPCCCPPKCCDAPSSASAANVSRKTDSKFDMADADSNMDDEVKRLMEANNAQMPLDQREPAQAYVQRGMKRVIFDDDCCCPPPPPCCCPPPPCCCPPKCCDDASDAPAPNQADDCCNCPPPPLCCPPLQGPCPTCAGPKCCCDVPTVADDAAQQIFGQRLQQAKRIRLMDAPNAAPSQADDCCNCPPPPLCCPPLQGPCPTCAGPKCCCDVAYSADDAAQPFGQRQQQGKRMRLMDAPNAVPRRAFVHRQTGQQQLRAFQQRVARRYHRN